MLAYHGVVNMKAVYVSVGYLSHIFRYHVHTIHNILCVMHFMGNLPPALTRPLLRNVLPNGRIAEWSWCRPPISFFVAYRRAVSRWCRGNWKDNWLVLVNILDCIWFFEQRRTARDAQPENYPISELDCQDPAWNFCYQLQLWVSSHDSHSMRRYAESLLGSRWTIQHFFTAFSDVGRLPK